MFDPRHIAIVSATAGAASKDGNEKDPEDQDEEDDAAGVLTQPVEIEDDGTFIPRWRTRVFCMECIKRILEGVRDGKREHFDLALARKHKARDGSSDFLVLFLQVCTTNGNDNGTTTTTSSVDLLILW
jgi:hypothetical protein